MNQHFKDKRKWHTDLKKWMEANLPPICENCGSGFGLTIAHATKQRFIRTREDYFRAALLCLECHQDAEFGTHERMAEIIDGYIERRQL